MIDFFSLFKRLDCELEQVIINNNYDVNLINSIIVIYCKYKDELFKVSTLLNELAQKEINNQESFDFIADAIEYNHNNSLENELEDSIIKMQTENAFILALLTQVGKNLSDGCYKLAVNDERKKDFFKLLEITFQQCDEFITLDGLYSNRDMCYSILEKGYTITSNWINISLSIMENCMDNEE